MSSRAKRGTGNAAIANYVRRNYPWILPEAAKAVEEETRQLGYRLLATSRRQQIARTREQIEALQNTLRSLEGVQHADLALV